MVGGHAPPWSPSGYDPGNATQYAASVAIQRRSVCVNAAAVSALLMTLPRTGRFLTVRLLPWDTQASKHASALISKCCHDVYVDHQRRRQRWLVLPNLSSLLISLFSRPSCRFRIALCGRSDNWESYFDAWLPNDRELIPSPHTGAAMHCILWPPRGSRAQCACVWLHSVAAAATS